MLFALEMKQQGDSKVSEKQSLPEDVAVKDQNTELDVNYRKRQIIIHHRYEWLHIINDFLLAIWFLIGSIFFLFSSLTIAGTWLFILGSMQMLMGPIIRTAHKLHVKDLETENINF